MADQVAHHRGDAGHRHQVAEREDGAERPEREHVAEGHEAVGVALEAPAAAEVDEHQLGRLDDPGVDHGLRPHRHGAVREDHGGVQCQPGGQHAHADEPSVAQCEGEEQDERAAEEVPAAAEQRDRHLQHDAAGRQGGQRDDGVAQVHAQRRAQDAGDGARHGGEEHGGHDGRRYRPPVPGPGRVRLPLEEGFEGVARGEGVDDLGLQVRVIVLGGGGVDDVVEAVDAHVVGEPLRHAPGGGGVQRALGLGREVLGELVDQRLALLGGGGVVAAPGEHHRQRQDHPEPVLVVLSGPQTPETLTRTGSGEPHGGEGSDAPDAKMPG